MTALESTDYALRAAEAAMKSAQTQSQMVDAMNRVARLRRQIRSLDARS